MKTIEKNPPTQEQSRDGFPIEAKIALGVIALGVAGIILKTFGVF